MTKVLFPLLSVLTLLFACSASAEGFKVHFSRPAVIDGKTFAAGAYYIHAPEASEEASVLIVNAVTGEETRVPVVRTAAESAKPKAVFAREGAKDRLEAIRTAKGSFEFGIAGTLETSE